MSRLMKKLLSFLFILTLLAAGFACAENETAGEKDLIILYTSDVHCGIDEGWGYAGLFAMKEALSEEYDVLLVDDGDHCQGGAYGSLTKGEAILEIMNAVGYDAAIPGNHEFDYGVDRLLELAGKADFPYICCNFFREGKQVFPSYAIREAGNKKIGFVGVTTPMSIKSSFPQYFQNEQGEFICDFLEDGSGEKLYAAVQKAVDEVTAQGVDYVVLLSHLGNDDICKPYTYADVINHTAGITAVLDGHSHDIEQVRMKNRDGQEVVRTACGTKLANVGALTITASGKVSSEIYHWDTKGFSAPTLLGLKNAAGDACDRVKEEMEDILSEVVMKTSVALTIADPAAVDEHGKPISIIRRAETNLGDFVADAFLSQCGGADIALFISGGARMTLKAGDITLRDLLSVLPYNNSIAIVEVTGQQLLDALEWGVHSMPDGFSGFIQVAGLTYEVDPTIPSPCVQDEHIRLDHIDESMERRIRKVTVNGEPLDPERIYKACGQDYMVLSGGDGYRMFSDCNVLMKDIIVDHQALIQYAQSLPEGAITERYSNPYGDGRIVSVYKYEEEN